VIELVLLTFVSLIPSFVLILLTYESALEMIDWIDLFEVFLTIDLLWTFTLGSNVVWDGLREYVVVSGILILRAQLTRCIWCTYLMKRDIRSTFAFCFEKLRSNLTV
jgi:hypothetical protein